jgi:hypothetical protein
MIFNTIERRRIGGGGEQIGPVEGNIRHPETNNEKNSLQFVQHIARRSGANRLGIMNTRICILLTYSERS